MKALINHTFKLNRILSISIAKKFKSEKYKTILQNSTHPETRQAYWKIEADDVDWYTKPTTILDMSNSPFYRWFPDGITNMSHNCLDRHVEKDKNTKAIIWESAYLPTGNKTFTYENVLSEVSKLSKVFKDTFKINKGDTVIIYMPNIPEAVFAMLACVRIGAIHSVVFGGFAAEELSMRIKDCQPKLIVTASLGIEPKKKIPYLPIVKDALNLQGKLGVTPVLLMQREEFEFENNFLQKDNIRVYQEEILKIERNFFYEPERIESNHPLYILYTSGTTGSPKGIFRDTGGTIVALNNAMKNIMDINHSDVYFATSDIGWVVGHSFIVYGPLLRGATTLLYEGKPIGTPHCGKFWELANKHNVKSIFTSPTALRAIRKEDPKGKVVKSYDMENLKSIHIAGERCDSETIAWSTNSFGEKILINDNWWQTETGWPITSNNIRWERFDVKPGAAGKPCPGYDIKIHDEQSEAEINVPNKLGKILIKLPMPPSFMLSLWGNDQGFVEKYISADGNYYVTGDAGYFDENGYLFIETRIDDIINVAGHRLSTGRIEEVLLKISGVAEAAVVGMKDELKGEIPFAFVLGSDHDCLYDDTKVEELREKIKNEVVKHIGAISRLKDVIIVNRLPKTRSGKILRGILKCILNKTQYKVPSSIEDITVLDDVIMELKRGKFI